MKSVNKIVTVAGTDAMPNKAGKQPKASNKASQPSKKATSKIKLQKAATLADGGSYIVDDYNIDIEIKKEDNIVGLTNKGETKLKAIRIATYKAVKRSADIVVRLIGTICLIPLTILIKLVNAIHGDFAPVFFKQKRIGKSGKTIYVYKFRSMVPNAEEILSKWLEENEDIRNDYLVHHKLEDDPRITKVGKILRATSLDECPQFFNILRGDMSFIGPRPYLFEEKNEMGEYYNVIIKHRPALTGRWQVSGRSNTTFADRLDIDAMYDKDFSLKQDVKIFFKTFTVVFKRDGAF